MDSKDFESLKRGLAEAHAYMNGEREGFVVHEPVDIKAIDENSPGRSTPWRHPR